MPVQTPTSTLARVSTTDARKDFADLLNRAAYGDEQILVERHGKPVAALISAERLEELEAIEDAMDGRAADQALDDGEFLTEEEFLAPSDDRSD
jgi:prevent-host-death family protein